MAQFLEVSFPLSPKDTEEMKRRLVKADDKTIIESCRLTAEAIASAGSGTDLLLREVAYRLKTAIECMDRR